MDINDLEQARDELEKVKRRLEAVDRELELLRGPACVRCRDQAANRTTLAGGYETILCLSCRNAWSAAADESGHWLEYRKADALAKAARVAIKVGNKPASSVVDHVEAIVAAERKLFQFAAAWLEKK